MFGKISVRNIMMLLLIVIVGIADPVQTQISHAAQTNALSDAKGSVQAVYPLLQNQFTSISQGIYGNYLGPNNHTGIDILTPGNKPDVRSICKGTVVYNGTQRTDYKASYDKYWNAFVIIAHDCNNDGVTDVHAYYGHLESDLKDGKNVPGSPAKVSAGDPIGKVRLAYPSKTARETPNSNSNHLHFSINVKFQSGDWGYWGKSAADVKAGGWIDPLAYFRFTTAVSLPINPPVAPVLPNNPPIAEAAVSKASGGPYYGFNTPLTVTKGQPISLHFFADKDVNGDGKVSLTPNGLAKVEWNTDLNKGTPSFEKGITTSDIRNANPPPKTYTFNDAPGTYEYQVLRITDKKTLQSNVSKIRITVVAPPVINPPVLPNNPPIAEAAVSKTSGGPYYGYNSPLTVTKGQSVNLYFFADKDVNGDGKASLDSDGWTHSDNGISSGGKVEWNTDLIKGTTPTYKVVKNNPSSAGAANIGPYTYTFNDAPGTYEYQVLKITDKKGQSGVSRIRITVVAPANATPTPVIAGFPSCQGIKDTHCASAVAGDHYQCTTYVQKNAGWNVGKLGTTLDEKKNRMNCKKPKIGAPGSVVVMSLGSYGHVGLVSKVNNNMITITDRNLCCDGTDRQYDISVNDSRVLGFIVSDDKYCLSSETSPNTNNPPIAEAAVSKASGGPYYGYSNPLTVTKGQAVNLYFFADKDVNGDGKASIDPDGWTSVSAGGKVEWNTDLNQGTPTFEKIINNPATAGAANIGPFPYTFNDAPGTYEYQVLRVTDQKGQSGVSRIKIIVVAPTVLVPVPTPCPSGNGLYCGDSGKGQNSGSLYQCINGSYSLNTNCTGGCQQNGAGKNDSCKASIVIAPPSCPSGNGLYCGDSGKGQNSGSLYQCTNGSYSLKKTCNSGCQQNSAGKDDECRAEPKEEPKPTKCPSGNGDYCGKSNLGQDTKSLYSCKDGKYSKKKSCSKGCKTNSAGKNDVCK